MLIFRRPRPFWLVFLSLGLMTAQLLTACADTPAKTPTPGVNSPATTTTAATTNASPANPAQPTTGPAPAISPTAGPAMPPGDFPAISPTGDYKPFALSWKIDLEDNTNAGIIGENSDMAFAKTRLGGLYALDNKSGAVVWKIAAPAQPLTGTVAPLPPLALVAPDLVVLGDPAAEKVTAYDAKSGQKHWDFDLKFNAPNRDKGSRFIGGKIYNRVLVVGVSSKQNPYSGQPQSANPEYLLIEGINLDTGKEVWSALTDPPLDPGRPIRFGDIVFASKLVLIESPDLTVGGIEAETGKRRWRVLDLFLLHNDNPDQLYSLVPQAGKTHNPVLARSDIETGKLLWQKTLPLKSFNDPLIVVSPDEKAAYVSVIVSAKESYVIKVNLTTNVLEWQLNTSRYGTYDLKAFNSGVRLRNFGKISGMSLFNRDNPDPEVWFAGGLEVGDVVDTPDRIYLTARDDKGGLLYLLDNNTGEIPYAARTDLSASVPYAGQSLLYLTSLNGAGKAEIYAFKIP